ncbi:MAG: F0F1 ATP synthase subunit B [Mycoplasmoidaceae bacterium]
MNISLLNTTPPIVEEALKIDIYVLIAHFIVLAILLIVIIWFAWKPTKKYLSERKKIIQEEIDNIEQSKKVAEENLLKSNELKNKSIDEANKILELAEVNAYNLKEKIKNEANLDANHIRDMAQSDLVKKEKELKENINIEVSNLAIEIAEALIKKKIDKETNQKLIDSLIDDLKSS